MARACDITGALVKATLLDEQLVIYRIKGQVVVARDVCPHRGVPLTLGFHEEEGIVCPYHGLRFGEDGRCNRIPSSPATHSGQTASHQLRRGGALRADLDLPGLRSGQSAAVTDHAALGRRRLSANQLPAFEVKDLPAARSKAFSMSPTSRGSTPTPSPIRTTSRCRTIPRRRRRSALLPTTGARWAITRQLRFPRAGRVPVAASL